MKVLNILPGKEKLFTDEIGNSPIFVKFYMDGCPHCENMKTDWSNLEKELTMNYDGNFTIMSVNARALNTLKHPLLENVQGFPTLFMINLDGTKGEDYNGERTKDEMLEFVLKHVNIHKKRGSSKTSHSSRRSLRGGSRSRKYSRKNKKSNKHKSKRSKRRRRITRRR
jgi:thiol-disulfide isomerase/thioredoxin